MRIPLLRSFLSICLLLVFFFIFNAITIIRYSHNDQARAADCAVVAGAGVEGEWPSPVFQARLNHAITLYQRGLVHVLILTGGFSAQARLSDAEIARRYVVAKGIPYDAVVIEEHSRVTRENIRYAKQLMQHHRLRTALIVSDPLHMRRLMAIVEDNGLSAWPSPTPTTRYTSWGAQSHFLLSETLWFSGYRLLRLLPMRP